MTTADKDFGERAKILRLRSAWAAAVTSGDIDRLLAMVTDDIVVVHTDGTCVCGKDALRADLARGFGRFDVEQHELPDETWMRGGWAIQLSDVDDNLMSIRGGAQVRVHLNTLAVFARQKDGSWKVARVLGLAS